MYNIKFCNILDKKITSQKILVLKLECKKKTRRRRRRNVHPKHPKL
jgi:hypothetical protein